MSDTPTPSLYESPALQAVTGPALRPGGLELTRRALGFCDLPAGARVVDIGCGTGVTVHFLRRHCRLEAFGLDRSSGMLGQVRQRDPGLPLVQGIATRLPFGDRRLAAVTCECVLSLVEDPDAALREFHRVLAPGGVLVVADVYARAPDHAGGLTSLPVTCCLKGAKSRDELAGRVQRSGFTLLVWEDHSQALKRLAAQLVFACGSLQAFWGAAGAAASVNAVPSAAPRARPGYFLAVARKEGNP
ncbi:MAG: methyltransferase domain-containing protein [Desulfobacteraceae bacterium]|nr:MAG: methyltransferase domain-containing protein [Desulfobacteraceae bacterium]